MNFMTFQKKLGISSSQLTNSYVLEGWLNHQPASMIDGFLFNVDSPLSYVKLPEGTSLMSTIT